MCNSFARGGLRNADINMKIASPQCSWIQRFYEDSFHEWKLIPFNLMNTAIIPPFKFHPIIALSLN